MKYRYDREIDRCQRYFCFKRTIKISTFIIVLENINVIWTYFLRSALRKIMERDDTSSKRLVLCVSSVQRAESTNPTTPSSKQTVLDPEVCLITVLIISKSLLSTFDYLYGYNFEMQGWMCFVLGFFLCTLFNKSSLLQMVNFLKFFTF